MTTPTAPVDPYAAHRALAAKVCASAHDVADARDLLEALGLVAYDGHELLPDDHTNIPIATLGAKPVGSATGDLPTKGRLALVGVEPPQRDRSMVPAGLRDMLLTPPATPAPARATPPKPARRGPAPKRKVPASRPTVADVRRDGIDYTRSERITAADLRAPAARTSTNPTPSARPAGDIDTTPEPTHRRTGPKTKPIDHGTKRGYFAHYRKKALPVCRACKDAYNGSRGPQNRETSRKTAAIDRARRSPRNVAPELDAWVESASTSPSAAVQRAAAVVSGSLMALRIAVGELARHEDAAITRTPAVDTEASA